MAEVIRPFASSADTKPRAKSSRKGTDSQAVKIPASGRQAAANIKGEPLPKTSPKRLAHEYFLEMESFNSFNDRTSEISSTPPEYYMQEVSTEPNNRERSQAGERSQSSTHGPPPLTEYSASNIQHIQCTRCGQGVQWVQCVPCSQQTLRYAVQPVPSVGQPLQPSAVPGTYYPVGESQALGARDTARHEWERFFPSFMGTYPREAFAILQQAWFQMSSTDHPGRSEPVPRHENDINYSRARDRKSRARENSREFPNEVEYQKQFQEYRQESEERIRKLNDVAQKLKAENEAFRAQIFGIGSRRGPLQEESYYIRHFNSLNTTIDQGVLKLVRQTKHALTEPLPVEEILKSISDLGDHGKKSAKFLGESEYSLQALYSQGPTRIALIGHVVAMLLVHRVFEPYGVGMSEEFSKGMRCLETDLTINGGFRNQDQTDCRNSVLKCFDDSSIRR